MVTAAALFLSFAQQPLRSFPAVDPYTKSAPSKVEAAGYVSLGPFRFGDDHTTDQVERALDHVPLIWVETRHFKLGSGLGPIPMPKDRQEKKQLVEEMERLGERLADVKTRIREIDPWLRLHLFAQRLEEGYGRFLAQAGLEERDFPTNPMDLDGPPGSYMGEGPYMGMRAKFAVLLLQRSVDLERYAALYLGGAKEEPLLARFPAIGGRFLGLAADRLTGEYDSDAALACAVVDGLTRTFVRSFRGDLVPVPYAAEEGLAHWFARQRDPRFHFFRGPDPAENRITDDWNWPVRVHERVEKKSFPGAAALLALGAGDEPSWGDHMLLWSRVDHLFAQGGGGAFLRSLKEPLPALREEGVAPERLAEHALEALTGALGMEPEPLDAAWAEWVAKTYPAK
jgi:hypothetical protein